MAEYDELVAIQESLENFASAHGAEYFCAILLPADKPEDCRHSIFKFGEAGKAIAQAVRDLPIFTT